MDSPDSPAEAPDATISSGASEKTPDDGANASQATEVCAQRSDNENVTVGSVVDLYPPREEEAAVPSEAPAAKPAKARAARRSKKKIATVDVPSAAEAPVQTAELKAPISAMGWVELHGVRYDSDLIVHVDGSISKRDKTISKNKKEKYGHTPLTGKELERLLMEAPEMIIIGTGHNGAMPLTPKAERMLNDYLYFVGKTPRALVELAAADRKVIALLHVSC